MDDQEKNISPEQPNEPSRNPKEDIPLWLQGLEEETKANRLRAAEEEAHDSFPSEHSLSSSEPLEATSEELDVEEEGFPTEEEPSDQIDAATAEEIEDEILLPKEEPRISIPSESENDFYDSDDFPFEEIEEETEEIQLTPVVEPLNDNTSPDWFNEISDIAVEPTDSVEELTEPQDIPDNVEPSEPSPEAPTNSEDNLFIDISEADIENDLGNSLANENDLLPDNEQQIFVDEEPEFGGIETLTEDEQPAVMDENVHSDDENLTFVEETSSKGEESGFGDDEMLPDDEELPKWLQRLIADSYPDHDSNQMMILDKDRFDEITKPVQVTPPQTITAETNEFEEIEDFGLIEEFEELSLQEDVPGDNLSFENETETPEIDSSSAAQQEETKEKDDAGYSITVEDTQPTNIEESTETKDLSETKESIEWSKEDNLYFNPENGYLIEIPEALQFARQVLKHGDTAQALDIIKTYISQASYLDEIKVWLLEAADSSMDYLSEIWESIGDIATFQSDYQEALTAYSKAINYLLVYKDDNGTC